MPEKAKSQWDFGELFPPEAARPEKAKAGSKVKEPSGELGGKTSNIQHRTSNIEGESRQSRLASAAVGNIEGEGKAGRRVLTVGELTAEVRRLLETQVGQIWVTGEVTNLRAQSSGHIYFTLKDAESQLSCVLFRNEARASRGLLKDGQKVVLQGELTVYEPRGQYQLRVTAVELRGVGALQLAFEQLKQKLSAEGLFATERKRVLPRFPERIGLVTSPTGAAIRDVLHVVRRRHAGLEIVLAPCRVQGQGAGEEIADAIRLLNEFNNKKRGTSNIEGKRPLTPALSPNGGEGEGMKNGGVFDSAPRTPHSALDLILVTRGGGSLEDLWAFNEEVVARAIYESELPVVSAVGHEIDFTISDFVADLRAATPSAAAELITEGVYSSGEFVRGAVGRMGQLLRQHTGSKEWELEQVTGRLGRMHPRRRFNEWLQELDDLQGRLLRCAKQGTRNRRAEWRNLRERLSRARPRTLLKQRREVLEQVAARLGDAARGIFESARREVSTLEARLRLLGPEQVLARGYSITMDEKTGKAIRSAKEVKEGQGLRTRLKTGEVRSVVKRKAQ
jgi:exodeoxyribonuclease VII large subunit